MKISNINNSFSNNYRLKKSDSHNEVSFQGNRLNVLKYALNKGKQIPSDEFASTIADFLDDRASNMMKYAKRMKRHKMDFLYNLANKFSVDSYKSKFFDREGNKKLIFQIYDAVKYPKKIDSDIVGNYDFTFEQLHNIFNASKNSPEKLELIDKLSSFYPTINGKNKFPEEIVSSILSSDSVKEINANYNIYKPFIALNKGNSDLISRLEEEIKIGYDAKFYQNELSLRNFVESHPNFKSVDSRALHFNFNDDSFSLLDKIATTYFNVDPKSIDAMSNDILAIYKTTNNNNLKARNGLVDFVSSSIPFDERNNTSSIQLLKTIFDKVDNNELSRIFIEKSVDSKVHFVSLEQINDVIDRANLEKLCERMDLVKSYAASKGDLIELSNSDFSKIDKRIKMAKEKEKREFEFYRYNPNPFVQDMKMLRKTISKFANNIKNIFSRNK